VHVAGKQNGRRRLDRHGELRHRQAASCNPARPASVEASPVATDPRGASRTIDSPVVKNRYGGRSRISRISLRQSRCQDVTSVDTSNGRD
jgi:hypothetical protein